MVGNRPGHGGTLRGRVLKALLWTLCVLVLAVAITAYVLYRSASTAPTWYVQPGPASASQPARELESKLIEIQTWAGARYAWDYAHNTGRQPLAREPDSRLTITLSEDEVNALLQKWFVIYGQEKVGGKRVMDILRGPMVHFTPEGIALAATVADMGSRVLSLELRPEVLPDGQLNLQLLAIRAGTLSLPEFAWSKGRAKVLENLSRQLPALIGAAALDRGGGANGELVSAVSASQAIATLQHRPTTNAMFLPIISDGNALPVRVESVELGEGSLTLTVETMTPEQRQELLDGLRR